tara:strand:- start:1951 stop:2157 length:207 start_codon:yes stop_codon:yes gene_type:complete
MPSGDVVLHSVEEDTKIKASVPARPFSHSPQLVGRIEPTGIRRDAAMALSVERNTDDAPSLLRINHPM